MKRLEQGLVSVQRRRHDETAIGDIDVRVERTTREGSFDSFTDYGEPIKAGVGSIPKPI
jgi:hypothetical protein